MQRECGDVRDVLQVIREGLEKQLDDFVRVELTGW